MLQFDEDYESVNRGAPAPGADVLAAQLKKSLEVRAQTATAATATQPMPAAQAKRQTLETIPTQSKPVMNTIHHPSTLLLRANKSQTAQGHLSDEYISDEYESVTENVSLPLSGCGPPHGKLDGRASVLTPSRHSCCCIAWAMSYGAHV